MAFGTCVVLSISKVVHKLFGQKRGENVFKAHATSTSTAMSSDRQHVYGRSSKNTNDATNGSYATSTSAFDGVRGSQHSITASAAACIREYGNLEAGKQYHGGQILDEKEKWIQHEQELNQEKKKQIQWEQDVALRKIPKSLSNNPAPDYYLRKIWRILEEFVSSNPAPD